MKKIAIINKTGGGMSWGYRKYLQNIIPRMARHNDVEEVLCASPDFIGVQDWFDPMPNVRFVTCKPFRFLFPHYDVELLRELEKFSPDVVFVPIERSFKFKNVPVVNMIQNMEPFVTNFDGNPVSERIKEWAQYVDGKKTIKNSDKVIAVSKFAFDFPAMCWNISNEKMVLVYYGIDAERGGSGRRPYCISEEWKNQFFFTAGSIRPARGLEDLLSAMKFLESNGEKSVKLVVAGESGQRMAFYHKKLKNWAQKNGLSDRICWAGTLNENEMDWCYQNCGAFVMTSRVESFGMIAGEAMSQGCICISSDNPCLPEVFGDAAVYYPSSDGKALAGVIEKVLVWNEDQRKVMSEKAKKRTEKFSWDVCAEKTVATLLEAAERK